MMNYWWYKNKQNRINPSDQLIIKEDLTEIENYTYSYYSNTNFLSLNSKKEINGNKYNIRLDDNSEFKYFSTLLGASPLFDNALEKIKSMTTNDIKSLIIGSANLYPEKVCRYYSNNGTYQYILLDYTNEGNACIKIVKDKFIPSSYSAFRPLLHRVNVDHDLNEKKEIADEYKFISEDGCYLIDQNKIASLDDVLALISNNPCYIDQINPHFFTNDDVSVNIQNLDIIRAHIDKAFSNPEVVRKLIDLNRPLYTKRVIDDKIIDLVNSRRNAKFTPKVEEEITDEELISNIYKRVNKIIKDKVEELKFLEKYENYALEQYEKAFLDLGLIPNVSGLKEKFVPALKKKEYLSKDTKSIIRRFMKLSYLKDINDKLELYRDEVMAKIKQLPQDNEYLANGEEKSQIIKNNETIRRYELEILSSGYKYKNKDTGIISALNNEYNELNVKIDKYFTLPTQDTLYNMSSHLKTITGNDWDIINIYIPHSEHSSSVYNSKPMVCLVNKDLNKEYKQYMESYVIQGASSENAHLKNIESLINEGTIIPICMSKSNFGTIPSVNDFRNQKTIFLKKLLIDGEYRNVAINTYSIKRINTANKLYKGLKDVIIDLADNNVKKVDRPSKSK